MNVRLLQEPGSSSIDHEVARDQVVSLSAVTREYAMTLGLVDNVALYEQVLNAAHAYGAIERPVDDAVLDE